MERNARMAFGGLIALAVVTGSSSAALGQEELGPLTGVYSVVAKCEQSARGVFEDDLVVYRYFARIRQGPRFTQMRLTEKGKPARDYSLYYLGRVWPPNSAGAGFMRACGGSYFRDENMLVREPDDSGMRLTFEVDSVFTTNDYPEQLETRIAAKCEYDFKKLPRDVVPRFPECGIEPGAGPEPGG